MGYRMENWLKYHILQPKLQGNKLDNAYSTDSATCGEHAEQTGEVSDETLPT